MLINGFKLRVRFAHYGFRLLVRHCTQKEFTLHRQKHILIFLIADLRFSEYPCEGYCSKVVGCMCGIGVRKQTARFMGGGGAVSRLVAERSCDAAASNDNQINKLMTVWMCRVLHAAYCTEGVKTAMWGEQA